MKLMLALTIALFAVLAVNAAPAPTPGAESPDCHDARVWHLQAAMKHTQSAEQAYHLGAADAAYMLAEYGPGVCVQWKQDATGTVYYGDGTTATGEDATEGRRP